jgi:hypothetical protein
MIKENIAQIAYGIFFLFFVTISLLIFIKSNANPKKNSIPKNTIENICNRLTAVHQSIQNPTNLFGSFIKDENITTIHHKNNINKAPQPIINLLKENAFPFEFSVSTWISFSHAMFVVRDVNVALF